MYMKIRSGQGVSFGFATLLLILTLAGSQIPAETAETGNESWQQELLKEREQKDIEFKTSATSPMAGSMRLTISAPEKTFIMIKNGSISLQTERGAGAVFSVFSGQGKWYWDDAAPDVTCRLGERSITQNTDVLPAGSLFRAGRFTLAVYPGPDTLAMIVFDPQRKQLRDFERLLYFPPAARYLIKARLEKFPEKREVKIITTRKLEKTFYRYARVHFQLEGRELKLTAFKSSLEGQDSATLFIPFKDATNGRESYEVGRFIDVPEPVGEEFVLDFNRCYNPLCNYSAAYNCPLPPLENFLDVAISAGEKTYPH
jgi:uncharacterized protein (DUF1684 family)